MSSLSKLKTRSAAEALSALNPFVRTVLYQKRADGDSITDILRDRPWDFILDCTDNYPTKFLINDACVREKKPFCHAGFLRFAGQAMTYVPGKGPCLRCLFGGVPPEERAPSPAKFGVVGAVCGIFGSIEAAEAIKYIIGKGELLTGKLLTADALTMTFRKIDVPRDPDCPACEGQQE